MFDYFDSSVPWEIREQILRYNATWSMSDVERARFLKLPEGCRIRENAKIISQDKLKIGEHCWIGEGAILDASGGLEIGEHTSIGLNVFVWTHDSYRLNIRGQNTKEHSSQIIRKKTVIGSNCFIAGPSVVMPGVTIGSKCVIAPMSVVLEDLPSKTIYTPYRDMLQLKEESSDLKKRVEQLEKLIRKDQQ